MKTLELFTFFLCMSSVLPLPQNFDDIDISKDQPKDEKEICVYVIFKIFFLVAVVQFIHNLSLKLVSFLTLRVIRISNFSII